MKTGGQEMHKLSEQTEDGIFITIETASRLTNLGRNTVRKLAQEGNAARKIGKSFRINRQVFLNYLDSFEA